MEKSLQPGFISLTSIVINQATVSCSDFFLCSEGYQIKKGIDQIWSLLSRLLHWASRKLAGCSTHSTGGNQNHKDIGAASSLHLDGLGGLLRRMWHLNLVLCYWMETGRRVRVWKDI